MIVDEAIDVTLVGGGDQLGGRLLVLVGPALDVNAASRRDRGARPASPVTSYDPDPSWMPVD